MPRRLLTGHRPLADRARNEGLPRGAVALSGLFTWRAALLAGMVAGCLVTSSFAQQPSIEWRVDARSLEPGESMDTQLVLTNTGAPEAPVLTAPEGVKLQLVNPNPSTMSQTSIINGQMSQSTTHTFVLRLTAIREGTYALGPLVVQAGGKKYSTEPVTVTVRKSATAQNPRGDQYVFAAIDVAPTALYVSQTYRATLSIGIRKVIINGRPVEMNLLSIIDGTGSELSIFPRSGWTSSEMTLSDSQGHRYAYEVFRVSTTAQANDVGEIAVGPVFLRANYPLSMRRGFFGDEVTRARRETARAEAVMVTVKAPPAEGRPADFSGAIGHYDMKVTAKPERVEQGQPVTLAIAFRGAPLGGVAAPVLGKNAELASRFDFTPDELVGDMEGEWKVFRRAIFPKQTGEQSVPTVSWSYFDVAGEKYATLSSDPIRITVDPPRAGAVGGTPVISAPPSEKEAELTVLQGGLSPNYVDAERVLVDQSLIPRAVHAISLSVPPLFYLAVFLVVRRRRHLRTNRSEWRRQRAMKAARARMASAKQLGQPAAQWRSLADGISEYVGDRFDLSAHSLTPAEVRAVLAQHRVNDQVAGEIIAFLEQCDASRYAPQAVDAAGADHAADRVQAWLNHLERHPS